MPRNRRKRHLADAGAVLLFDWVQTLPAFAQPIANGALVVVFVVLVRGLIVLPLFMLYLLFVSHAPLAELTLAAQVIGLGIFGGSLSGLSYSVLGRQLCGMGRLGRYAAGITTILPYMAVGVLTSRLASHQPVFAPFQSVDWIVMGCLSLLFGVFIGEFWFGEDRPLAPHDQKRTIVRLLGVGAVLIVLAIWYASSVVTPAPVAR